MNERAESRLLSKYRAAELEKVKEEARWALVAA